jgi:hypothetical protein
MYIYLNPTHQPKSAELLLCEMSKSRTNQSSENKDMRQQWGAVHLPLVTLDHQLHCFSPTLDHLHRLH